MPFKYLIIIVFLFVTIFACKKQQNCVTVTYFGNNFTFEFVGFNCSQLDSCYVIDYALGSNFAKALDTSVFGVYADGNICYPGPLSWQYGGNTDVAIIIPNLKTVHFTQIKMAALGPTTECEPCGLGCGHGINSIVSYQQDGVTMTAIPAVITN